MSRSATPATRNEATRRLKPPKMTTFAELTIGTAIRPSRGRLRTVANGWARSSEHTLNPQTPRVKREPLLRIREKHYKSAKDNQIMTCIYYMCIYIYAVFSRPHFPELARDCNVRVDNACQHWIQPWESHAISVDFGSGWPSRAWMRRGRRLA